MPRFRELLSRLPVRVVRRDGIVVVEFGRARRSPARPFGTLPAPKARAWPGLAASVVLHVGIAVLILGLRRAQHEEGTDPAERTPAQDRAITMVYMPPPERTARAPEPRPEPPRSAPAEPEAAPPLRVPSPDAVPTREPVQSRARPPLARPDAPHVVSAGTPEGAREEGEERPEPREQEMEAVRGEEPQARPEAAAPTGVADAGAEAAAPAPTMESEAKRIFGRPSAPRSGAGPRRGIALTSRPDQAGGRETTCLSPPRDPGGPVELGTVTGRVFRSDNGRPLAGAHLQIIGTPYVGFTDGEGYYRLTFDVTLVDECRTQYVRVTADGYEGRLLVLALGSRSSDDVFLERH